MSNRIINLTDDLGYHTARKTACDCGCTPGWHAQQAGIISDLLRQIEAAR